MRTDGGSKLDRFMTFSIESIASAVIHVCVCLAMTCTILNEKKRVSANADPTNRNYTTELSAFGIIAGVNPAEVQ